MQTILVAPQKFRGETVSSDTHFKMSESNSNHKKGM